MARGDFPSTKQDQFNLRLPAGMRDEIQRLAAEDGRSMNAQIIELLNFAIQNSGLDIDEIMQMLVVQRQEMNDLRKQISVPGDRTQNASDVQRQLDECRQALKQKDGLLMAVCLQLFMNRDVLPAESVVLADSLLKSAGEVDLLDLNEDEVSALPVARYHALVRRFFKKKGAASNKKDSAA
ncbi:MULTISPECIES: Arc family DNA-binding protein [unclassified Rhizobium]|uniref:Arc family DNA-binding protein n=1 Tax=unclassified Rhizobium TaxID=2613769 RepID=UPI0007EB151B|nr:MULTISPECIES: Arc family DNA-binding protein [unclassified Rhizobium]ANK84460.1 ribbon-helix-helix domain-containing protein [Rhizobium sp. N731]ANL14708.1 ribbon-helix-helix domain-containing protein [Rhizobium sp. N1314]